MIFLLIHTSLCGRPVSYTVGSSISIVHRLCESPVFLALQNVFDVEDCPLGCPLSTHNWAECVSKTLWPHPHREHFKKFASWNDEVLLGDDVACLSSCTKNGRGSWDARYIYLEGGSGRFHTSTFLSSQCFIVFFCTNLKCVSAKFLHLSTNWLRWVAIQVPSYDPTVPVLSMRFWNECSLSSYNTEICAAVFAIQYVASLLKM